MKNSFIIFIFFQFSILHFSSINTYAQNNKVNDSKLYPKIDTLTEIAKNSESIINLIINDEEFVRYKCVLNRYKQIENHDSTISYTKTVSTWDTLEKKVKKVEVLVIEIFNPFKATDYNFVVKQRLDTNYSIHIPLTNNSKTFIDNLNESNSGYIIIEKPIFSSNFNEAFTRIETKFWSGCGCYNLYFKKIDGTWILYRKSRTCIC